MFFYSIRYSVIFKTLSFALLSIWMMLVLEVDFLTIFFVLALNPVVGLLSALTHNVFTDNEKGKAWLAGKALFYSAIIDSLLLLKTLFYSQDGDVADGLILFDIVFAILVFLVVSFYTFSDWTDGPISEYERKIEK
jgi:hypothetical protein